MKVSVIRTRIRGVLLPKRAWSRETTYDGDLTLSVTRDNRLNRMTKIARVVSGDITGSMLEFLDVSLEWVNDERLVLTGFEPYLENNQTIDYAQSWLCLVGAGRRLKTEQEQFEEEQLRTTGAQSMTRARR